MNDTLRKIIYSGILASLSIIAFIIEGLFPPLFIPGARMGISNIFILLALLLLNEKYAYAVLIIKILLGSLLIGNVSAILYSLPAGIISLSVEVILIRFTKKFSIISISVLGATVNTAIQNTVFCLISKSFSYFMYLPYLTLIAVVTGIVIGFTVYLLVKYLPANILHTHL